MMCVYDGHDTCGAPRASAVHVSLSNQQGLESTFFLFRPLTGYRTQTAPYSCHGYTDRDSNATFPHGKHGPSQVLKTASYSGKFINLCRWYCRLLLLRALVSMSACCSDVDTNLIEMSPDLNNPRMKWYLTSMCLLRAELRGFCTKAIAP